MYEEIVERLKIAADWAGKGFRITPSLCLEAADAIEKLIAFNAMWQGAAEFAKENKPKWIPVTERLPEKYDCYYLVVLNNWNTDFCLYTKEKGFGMYITPKWWDANDEVTHWMPLPEPPKEGR